MRSVPRIFVVTTGAVSNCLENVNVPEPLIQKISLNYMTKSVVI